MVEKYIGWGVASVKTRYVKGGVKVDRWRPGTRGVCSTCSGSFFRFSMSLEETIELRDKLKRVGTKLVSTIERGIDD